MAKVSSGRTRLAVAKPKPSGYSPFKTKADWNRFLMWVGAISRKAGVEVPGEYQLIAFMDGEGGGGDGGGGGGDGK